MYPVPDSDHNQELAGDTLTSVLLNYQWRKIIADAIDLHLQKIASTIADETDRQEFEARCGNLLIDFYNQDVMDFTPVGTINAFFSDAANIPDKWLLCDGSVYDVDDYPELAAILPAGYSGGGNFGVPDLTDRFLYGTSSPTGGVGILGGEAQVTLTTAQIPAHTHVQNGRNSPAGGVNQSAVSVNVASRAAVATTTSTGSAGGGDAHNNLPPYVTVNWIIKALP